MKENKGYVMVLALVIASALLILLSTIIGTIIIQRRLVDRSYHRERALALAESGIDAAIAYLNEKNLSKPGLLTGNIAGMGEFEVRVVSPDNTVTLTSDGYSKQRDEDEKEKAKAKRTILVIANLTMKGTIFEYAIASRGSITIRGATITGDIIAVDSVDNSGTVNGTITEGAEGLEFPEFDSDYYKTYADIVKSGGWEIEDDYSFGDKKIIYVEGNVEIKGSTLTGPGVIVAEGKIEVENGILGTSSAPVGLISMSSEEDAIEIKGDDTEIYGMLWAPNGGVEIKDEVILYGSVVSGGDIEIKDGPRLIYYLDFSSEIYAYFKGNYLITSWSEIL